MNTSQSASAPPVYLAASLRVTAVAIELRDRSYRLDSVRSVRATRVRSNRTMLGLLIMLAVFVVATVYFSLRLILASDLIVIGTDLGNVASIICLAFNLALVIGLVIFYRATMKGWHYVYLARLQRKLWYTDIAASLRPEPLDEVVSAVSQAVRLFSRYGPPSEPATLYVEEHSIRIEDNDINVDGQSYPTGSIIYASADAISTSPWYVLAWSYLSTFLFIKLYGTLTRIVPSEVALVLVLGIAAGLFLIWLAAGRLIQHVNKDKHYPANGAHECKLHTSSETIVALASVDREFIKEAANAVNALARGRTASIQRRPSATTHTGRTSQ